MPLKTFKFVVPGLVRVWHTPEGETVSHDFIIHERDNAKLTLEQLKELLELKRSGKLQLLHPSNEKI